LHVDLTNIQNVPEFRTVTEMVSLTDTNTSVLLAETGSIRKSNDASNFVLKESVYYTY